MRCCVPGDYAPARYTCVLYLQETFNQSLLTTTLTMLYSQCAILVHYKTSSSLDRVGLVSLRLSS